VFCPYPYRPTIPIAAYPPEPTAVCRPTLLSLRQRTHLSRHSICKGFFNKEAFLSWVVNGLLPHLNPFPEPRRVVCLGNLNVHLDPRIQTALEDKGCLIKFLPPYSPDYSPIELTFSVLKAWIRPRYRYLRYVYQGDFGGFLQHAIEQSGYDKHAMEHFHHAADRYKFEGDYEAFMQELEQWSRRSLIYYIYKLISLARSLFGRTTGRTRETLGS
jgi:hypothetical protein